MRAWIEIFLVFPFYPTYKVALFMRAWIEIAFIITVCIYSRVALFMRAWIEIAGTAWKITK